MSTVKVIADMFEEMHWSGDFTRDDAEIIACSLGLHTHEPGDCIFREGDDKNYMAFIAQGHVDIVKKSPDCTERVLVTLGPKTHFGEMAFIDDEPRSASATARDKVTLLILTRDKFDYLVGAYPALGVKMLRSITRLISRRLRQTTGNLAYFGTP
ncbi:MAG: cyclic nucleotide-binding domain-containing protein [Desulfovibrionaceae bacterium]|nr:cyclic nucleotide-binding domain-containing protein [Desulfovibrionaceae bacterium]